jgi:hypothetical protein
VERCVQIGRELLVRPAPQPTQRGHALNMLAGAAVRYRERLGNTDPPWTLIGCFSYGCLLAPPLIT